MLGIRFIIFENLSTVTDWRVADFKVSISILVFKSLAAVQAFKADLIKCVSRDSANFSRFEFSSACWTDLAFI